MKLNLWEILRFTDSVHSGPARLMTATGPGGEKIFQETDLLRASCTMQSIECFRSHVFAFITNLVDNNELHEMSIIASVKRRLGKVV